MPIQTEAQTTRGRPPVEDPSPAPRKQSPSERERELRADVDQAKTRLRRAQVRLNVLHNDDERKLTAELSNKLPEHAHQKLDGADVLGALRDDVRSWAESQAGISGDPKPPPTSAALLYLLDKDENGFRGWLGTQIDALAADPNCAAYTSRERAAIEADLEQVRKQIKKAEAEVDAAREANREAEQALAEHGLRL